MLTTVGIYLCCYRCAFVHSCWCIFRSVVSKHLIKLPRYVKSDGEKYDVLIRLDKILYVKSKAAGIWY